MTVFKLTQVVYLEADHEDEAYDWWFMVRDLYSRRSEIDISAVQFQGKPHVDIIRVPLEELGK